MASSMLPKFASAGLLAATLLLGASNASAQTVSFAGFTNARFCNLAHPLCVNNGTSAYQQIQNNRLIWTNSTFTADVPNGGNLNLNGAASALGTQNVNNFGAFYLGGRNITYNTPFSLWITFTQPASTVLAYSAMITGVISGVNGNINIDFGPSTQNITFAGGAGWASITLNDIVLPGEQTTSITGIITAEVVPEPMTMTLLATGLIGLAGVARRRRKKLEELA